MYLSDYLFYGVSDLHPTADLLGHCLALRLALQLLPQSIQFRLDFDGFSVGNSGRWRGRRPSVSPSAFGTS